MLNVLELERQWRRYKLRQTVPFFMFLFIGLFSLPLFYFWPVFTAPSSQTVQGKIVTHKPVPVSDPVPAKPLSKSADIIKNKIGNRLFNIFQLLFVVNLLSNWLMLFLFSLLRLKINKLSWVCCSR